MEEKKNSPPQNRHFGAFCGNGQLVLGNIRTENRRKRQHIGNSLCVIPLAAAAVKHISLLGGVLLYCIAQSTSQRLIISFGQKFSARIRHKAIITVIFSTAARQQIDITALCNIKIMSVFANITFFVFYKWFFAHGANKSDIILHNASPNTFRPTAFCLFPF